MGNCTKESCTQNELAQQNHTPIRVIRPMTNFNAQKEIGSCFAKSSDSKAYLPTSRVSVGPSRLAF